MAGFRKASEYLISNLCEQNSIQGRQNTPKTQPNGLKKKNDIDSA